jgi:cytochrome c peroxidase
MDRSINNNLVFGLLLVIVVGMITAGRCTHPAAQALGPVPFPDDNPLTAEKIELGRKLFFDKRLSDDNSIACVDCHHPEKAFTDGKVKSSGIHGGMTDRNAPSLLNCAYLPRVMFDGELKTLEMQVIVPVQEHSEMSSDMLQLIKELRAVPEYEAAAQRIFGRTFDPYVLTRSIASFERSLVSQNSAYDRYVAGDAKALTVSQKRGLKLFSEDLYCAQCHPGPHFTTYAVQNNGLYTDYGTDQGRFRIDNKEADRALFKVPGLRNITLTAPYMHDGSFATLEEVLDHYSAGGKGHVNQSKIIVPFQLNEQQRKDLINFFGSLTDTTYLRNFQ